uniref:hypothetical protein n=1 Tax=Janibacter melonis TaxID=262209 RepID=UPI001749AE2F
MTAGVMHHVHDVRPAPVGWTVRHLEIDPDTDEVTAATLPVIALAVVRSCAVADGLDADVATAVQPAVLDEDGDVTALCELNAHGRSVAVALAPGRLADDVVLAARLRAEQAERPPVTLA